MSYECTVSLGVALELLSSEDDNSPMSCYRNTRIVGSRLDGIINATLTGFMSSRCISVAFLMCTTMVSSSADPDSKSRRTDGRGGWL